MSDPDLSTGRPPSSDPTLQGVDGEAAAPAARPRSAAGAPGRGAAYRARVRDHFYGGPLPRRPLRFAEFLYYSGRASFWTFTEALGWQRRQRPAIGRLAVDAGHLTPDDVSRVLEERRRAGAGGTAFGEVAVRMGLLSPPAVSALVARQRTLQRPIGQFFVERGVLLPREPPEICASVMRHNARWR